ncbi:hypothetical protein ACSLBF_15125 [Pseudoalteromonas sp. T1lg65]|uniref:hypothetical protein n=1 Tax=Pseudoalteromonas sp. T1lg65 TaxID=2077101 RepID=UPI003F7A8248
MFKKSLLALALAGLATSAVATEVVVTNVDINVEGVSLASNGLTVAGGASQI